MLPKSEANHSKIKTLYFCRFFSLVLFVELERLFDVKLKKTW